jgi:hypothetical protein
MLSKFAKAALISATLMAAITGCGGGNISPPSTASAVQPAAGLQSVHIVDKGSEIVPGTSVTDLTPGKLSYALTGTARGTGDVKFDAVLAASDFDRLANLVELDKLTDTLGVPSSYDAPCRHLSYEIEIKRNNLTYQFQIPGTQVCGIAARAGLLDLLALRTELVNKYSPKPGS